MNGCNYLELCAHLKNVVRRGSRTELDSLWTLSLNQLWFFFWPSSPVPISHHTRKKWARFHPIVFFLNIGAYAPFQLVRLKSWPSLQPERRIAAPIKMCSGIHTDMCHPYRRNLPCSFSLLQGEHSARPASCRSIICIDS